MTKAKLQKPLYQETRHTLTCNLTRQLRLENWSASLHCDCGAWEANRKALWEAFEAAHK